MKSSFITGPNFHVCGFGEKFSQGTVATDSIFQFQKLANLISLLQCFGNFAIQ